MRLESERCLDHISRHGISFTPLHAWATASSASRCERHRGQELADVHGRGDHRHDAAPAALPAGDGNEIRPRQGLVKGNLPDTKASVMGQKSKIMPDLMLT